MLNKRGAEDEGAAAAATLILLIGLFIIGYVLLLPEADRKDLLGDLDSKNGDGTNKIIEPDMILLAESPGQLYASDKDEYSIKLTSSRLYSKTEYNLISIADTLKISSNLLSNKGKTIPFTLKNYDQLQDVYLFFFINEGEGTLSIKVNDQIVYEGKATSNEIPIKIPSYLVQKNNVLTISVNRWILPRDYIISDLQIKEVYLTENKQTRKSFEMTSGEKEGIKKIQLNYFVNCYEIDQNEQGVLSIYLNDMLLSEDHVVCDAGLQSYQLSKNQLNVGTNTLVFKIDTGDYGLEDLAVEIETTEKYNPTYTFEITDDNYEDILNDYCEDEHGYNVCLDSCADDYDSCKTRTGKECYSDYSDCKDDCEKDYEDCSEDNLFLDMTFGDDKDRKKAIISINKQEFTIDTNSYKYNREISDYIQLGSNYVKITPKTDFEVTDLKVYLEQKEKD